MTHHTPSVQLEPHWNFLFIYLFWLKLILWWHIPWRGCLSWRHYTHLYCKSSMSWVMFGIYNMFMYPFCKNSFRITSQDILYHLGKINCAFEHGPPSDGCPCLFSCALLFPALSADSPLHSRYLANDFCLKLLRCYLFLLDIG